MGTNYYWRKGREHIAKTSAAGYWCYDCNVTLCKGGITKVHSGAEWSKECPKCGKPRDRQHGSNALVELFGYKNVRKLTNVGFMYSLTWAQDPEYVKAKCLFKSRKFAVVDEYDRLMTGNQFLELIEGTQIKFDELIGQEFS